MKSYVFKSNPPPDLTSLSIEGDRIKLVSIHEDYAPEIFKEFTADIVRYMLPRAPDKIEETLAFITESQKGMALGYDLVMVILHKESGAFLGCCGLHGKGRFRTPEFGIWLKRAAHGQHYGRETILSLGSWAVKHIELDYIIYPVDRANTPSRKIPESLGGHIIREKQVKTMRASYLDELVYKIDLEIFK